MQNNIADTNPFKKLAEQERERKKLGKQDEQTLNLNVNNNNNRLNDNNNDNNDQNNLNDEPIISKPKMILNRPPIPLAPSLIPQNQNQNQNQSQNQNNNTLTEDTGDDYSNFVDSYAADDSDDDDDDSTSEDDLEPIDLDNPMKIPSKPKLQIPILPELNHSDQNSPDTSSILYQNLASPNRKSSINSNESKNQIIENHPVVNNNNLTQPLESTSIQQNYVDNFNNNIPYTKPVVPNVSSTSNSSLPPNSPLPPNSSLPQNPILPSTVGNESINEYNDESSTYLPIHVDPAILSNLPDTLDNDQIQEDMVLPVTPTRPPQLPQRSPIQRVSSLDPGSISTVGSHSFYNNSDNNYYNKIENSQTLENNQQNNKFNRDNSYISPSGRNSISNYNNNLQPSSPELPKRPISPLSPVSQVTPTSSKVNQIHEMNPNRPPIPNSQSYLPLQNNDNNIRHENQNFVNSEYSNSNINLNNSTPENIQNYYPPTSNVQNSFSRASSISTAQSLGTPQNIDSTSRISLPTITVTTPHNNAPLLPKKPSLPRRPPKLPTGSASAYELLENYGRRASSASVPVSDRPTLNSSITPLTTTNSTNPIDTNSIASVPVTVTNDDDLDIESLRNLGITDEMIRQQREIEARIQSENQNERRLIQQLAAEEGSHLSLPNINITTDNTDTPSISNESTSSELPTGVNDNEEISDDVSQLEIPTNISRTNSLSGDNSDNQSTISTFSSDPVVNEELTEEQFISLLPPVPTYTEEARDTEISIPNGMAINMLTINENHPKEDPPKYTPVSDSLKKIINRPQFSQTGGDTISIRRREQERLAREQERLRLEEQRQTRQNQSHHRHSRQSSGESSRYRSSQTSNSNSRSSRTGTSSRTNGSTSSSTRRLPPTRSMIR